jgi:hypothetical protein
MGFVVDKVALEQIFSVYFSFPCKFSFHRLLHTHHLSFGAGTIGKLVADVPSELSLTPTRETKKNLPRNNVSNFFPDYTFPKSMVIFFTILIQRNWNLIILWRVTPLNTHTSNYYFVYLQLNLTQSVSTLYYIYTAHNVTRRYSTEHYPCRPPPANSANSLYKVSSTATSR